MEYRCSTCVNWNKRPMHGCDAFTMDTGELEHYTKDAEKLCPDYRVRTWLNYWRERSKCGEEHEKASYGSQKSQESRFMVVARTLLQVASRVGAPVRIIDVGCGSGCFEKWFGQRQRTFSKRFLFVGVDFCEELIKQAIAKSIPRASFRVANAERLPFIASEFPYSVCIGLLQNCDNPFKVLEELLRVTRRAVIVDTLSEYAKYKSPINTYFSPKELYDWFQERGWSTEVQGIDTVRARLVPTTQSHAMLLLAMKQ